MANPIEATPNSVPGVPPATLIYDDWYPAMRSDRLRGRQTATAMLLGVPLLLGRTHANELFALRDNCPHRGIPLSRGSFDATGVTCRYHGWKFDPVTGQCREIPSLTPADTLDCSRIYATAFPCLERDGYAWVYVPSPGSGRVRPEDISGLPAVPELPKFGSRFRSAHLSADLPCNVDHGIIGLMDPAHGPFVHQSWWWRSGASIHVKEKQFEPIPQGFRMTAHAPSANSAPYKLLGVYGQPVTTTIDFVLPNRRYETIRCGDKWFSSLTTVTPVTPSTSRIDVYAAWNVFYHVPFVAADRQSLRTEICGAGSSDHGRAGAGIALQSVADADRRCRPPGKVVFCIETGTVTNERERRKFRTSLDRAGDIALAQLIDWQNVSCRVAAQQ